MEEHEEAHLAGEEQEDGGGEAKPGPGHGVVGQHPAAQEQEQRLGQRQQRARRARLCEGLQARKNSTRREAGLNVLLLAHRVGFRFVGVRILDKQPTPPKTTHKQTSPVPCSE